MMIPPPSISTTVTTAPFSFGGESVDVTMDSRPPLGGQTGAPFGGSGAPYGPGQSGIISPPPPSGTNTTRSPWMGSDTASGIEPYATYVVQPNAGSVATDADF
ncbi:MAG: hypothetical protein J6386_14900 [Candidatus Synoicihabitans palmerolidicus]|nr:hypothetical protein [Candidatus Synoicihabitans palmerolidicus]